MNGRGRTFLSVPRCLIHPRHTSTRAAGSGVRFKSAMSNGRETIAGEEHQGSIKNALEGNRTRAVRLPRCVGDNDEVGLSGDQPHTRQDHESASTDGSVGDVDGMMALPSTLTIAGVACASWTHERQTPRSNSALQVGQHMCARSRCGKGGDGNSVLPNLSKRKPRHMNLEGKRLRVSKPNHFQEEDSCPFRIVPMLSCKHFASNRATFHDGESGEKNFVDLRFCRTV